MNANAAATENDLESFASLFEESLTRKEMRAGELVTAHVVRIDHNVVVVNAGLKSESFIPVEEFFNAAGEIERLRCWDLIFADDELAHYIGHYDIEKGKK